jgi:hypothetical protein
MNTDYEKPRILRHIATRIIPPIVALVIAGVWLGSQQQSLSKLETEIYLIRKSIATRASDMDANSSIPKLTLSKQFQKKNKPLDWKKIAPLFENSNQANLNVRDLTDFHERLDTMTKEELVTALDEIATLDLPSQSRKIMALCLLLSLNKKDPALAVTSLTERLQDETMPLTFLNKGLADWADKDPAMAMAWFDQQIAAGKLESKTLDGNRPPRIQLEASLFHALLSSDPDTASRRLSALPEDQRGEILRTSRLHQLKEQDQLAYAKLVRTQVPENERMATLSELASSVVASGGYTKVTGYLDRIQATPTERAACIEAAAQVRLTQNDGRKITPAELDAMREWVGSQTPEATANITGKILGNAMAGRPKMEFPEAAALALKYNQASGNDEVLSSFLQSSAALQNKDEARALAAKISGVKLREQILKTLD